MRIICYFGDKFNQSAQHQIKYFIRKENRLDLKFI